MAVTNLPQDDGSYVGYEDYGTNLVRRQRNMTFLSSQSLADYIAMLSSLNEIGSITSRDQIINPYDIIDVSNYRNTKKGQALYNEDLAYLQTIAERQEAAYQEWYNSESQQALRQRLAGINPNLNGVESSVASDTAMPEGSPLDGIGTSGETAATIAGAVATAVGTIVSSVATLGALPATIAAASATALSATKQAGLIGAQEVGQQLANLDAFEGKVYGAAAANLADATAQAVQSGTKFDFDAWSSSLDKSGIFESYAPRGVTLDDPRYGSAYKRAIKNIQKLKVQSNDINTHATSSQTQFAKALADPYFDYDMLTQLAYLEPVSQAMFKIDSLSKQFELAKLNLSKTYVDGLDGDLAAKDFNERLNASIAKAGFDTNYYDGFDGDEVAALDLALKQSQSIINGSEAMIKAHFRAIWNDHSKPFAARAGALYQIMGGTPQNWKAWLASYMASQGLVSEFTDSVKPDKSSIWPNRDFSDPGDAEFIWDLPKK